MPYQAYSNPDNMVVEGELTVQKSGRYGLTGVSFDNGTIVSDGLGDMVVGGILTANGLQQKGIYNVLAYGAKGDGVHDDTAGIQAAINAAQSASQVGIVYLPVGTYKTSATLLLSTQGIVFSGAGYESTTIKPISGANFDVISTPAPPNSASSLNFIWVKDFTIDGSQMTGTTAGFGNGIQTYNVNWSKFDDIHFLNIPNWAFVENNSSGGDSYENHLYRLHIRDCAAGITGGGAGEGTVIQECTIIGGSPTTAANQLLYSSGGNNNTAYQVSFQNAYVTLTNSLLATGLGQNYAVRVGNSDILIYGNTFLTQNNSVIDIAGNHTRIIGNMFDVGFFSASSVLMQLAGDHNVIMGNTTLNSAVNLTWAIQESGVHTDNIISGNALVPGSSGMFSFNSSSTNKVRDNAGYNPVGSISPPSVPASGTAQINKFSVDATVFIAHGASTISNISIGGTSTGVTTDGAYRVPSGQSITLTYSGGTPSWTWFGD